MKNLFGAFIAWADHRTGLHTALRAFFLEQVPASSGWRHVLGSVALFLILLQAFTGILLSLNYAPTPGEAYNSLRYILSEVTGGSLIRGLHHWGASAIVIVVVLHMVQVFLWGAYKRPRETTWLAGVGLLLLTLAYGLTGYLLPWDNRAYWGTVVVTQMAAGAPVAGPFVARLLGGGGPVGVVTFARFYALHVLLLPPATFLLIAFHIYLVRKHGIAPAPGDEQRPRKAFFPVQVFKDTAAIFAAFAILFTLAAAVRVPLEELADPSNTAYIPRPEWYFLFMFETLRLMTGPFETLVSVVLPGAAVPGARPGTVCRSRTGGRHRPPDHGNRGGRSRGHWMDGPHGRGGPQQASRGRSREVCAIAPRRRLEDHAAAGRRRGRVVPR